MTRVKTTGYRFITEGSLSAHKNAMMKAPIKLGMYTNRAFKSYKGGIFDDRTCPTERGMGSGGHSVVGVGFGTSGGKEYVIIRNSWGDRWGEKGYSRLSTTQRYAKKGICGWMRESYTHDI